MVFERPGSRMLRTHWFLRVVGWAGGARRLQMHKTHVCFEGSWVAWRDLASENVKKLKGFEGVWSEMLKLKGFRGGGKITRGGNQAKTLNYR